ncbi:MAG: ATP-binding protein, partial [Halioglobus sp.]|nr:ATP-binding protein [Halioglobus sp.]
TAFAASGSIVFYTVAQVSSTIAVFLVSFAFARSLPLIWRHSTFEAYCLMLSLGIAIVLVAYDNLLVFGFLTRTSGQLAILGVPLLLGVFAYMVLRRFVAALDEREVLVRELEQRSEARALRIVDLEKASALADQRESIMRDMHDGLGGYLVSLLAIADKPEVDRTLLHDVVQQALTDMRLMLDSLDIDGEDLSLLIGALRDRMQPVLQAGGFDVQWHIAETPMLNTMSPHRALQVLRIVQECLNNAIKHSGASKIGVRLDYEPSTGEYGLEIWDNGRGMAGPAGHGRGLENIRHRAADIGGRVELHSVPGDGTCVRLLLPGDVEDDAQRTVTPD